jgi:hypothetical protein
MKVYVLVHTAHACTTIVSAAIDIHTFSSALVQLWFYSWYTQLEYMLVQSKSENIVYMYGNSIIELSIPAHAGPTNALTSIDLHSSSTLVQQWFYSKSTLLRMWAGPIQESWTLYTCLALFKFILYMLVLLML